MSPGAPPLPPPGAPPLSPPGAPPLPPPGAPPKESKKLNEECKKDEDCESNSCNMLENPPKCAPGAPPLPPPGAPPVSSKSTLTIKETSTKEKKVFMLK